ncbi:MAG: ribosome small subunit-dependent GTPase A [Elusimicrobia bacterium]|nr:ribosome small subunit-dependent GTPase A [Elusimicrobiota bacterium]
MRPRITEDSWLDDDDPARRKPGKKPIRKNARTLGQDEGNATVTEIFPNQAAALLDGAAKPCLCGYKMSTLAFGAAVRERSPVCVNDRVRVEAGVITRRCERRNRLIRPAPNARDPVFHVLAANMDCMVVVSSAAAPGFSPGLVDRFLVAASAQNIERILCVNKVDLAGPSGTRPWSHYQSSGALVVETSALKGLGTERLLALVRGRTAVFCGQSGAGKTSLLRRLLDDSEYGRIGAVNERSGWGRHTTSGAVLLPGPEGSTFIDTPGVMNFGLVGVKRGGLLEHFPELRAAALRCGRDCLHDGEPACGLTGLPRYASYRSIRSGLA